MKSNHILWWYKASLNSSCSFYSWLINMYFHHRCCARKARRMNLLWRNHYMWGRVSNGNEKAIENGIHRKEIMKNNESVFCVTVITIAVDRHSHQHYMYLFLIRFLPTHTHSRTRITNLRTFTSHNHHPLPEENPTNDRFSSKLLKFNKPPHGTNAPMHNWWSTWSSIAIAWIKLNSFFSIHEKFNF